MVESILTDQTSDGLEKFNMFEQFVKFDLFINFGLKLSQAV